MHLYNKNVTTTGIQQHIQQRGAVLLISIIILFLLALVATNSSTVTKIDERTSANLRDYVIAKEEAESVLLQVEGLIENLIIQPETCTDPTSCNICLLEDGTCGNTKIWNEEIANNLLTTDNQWIRKDTNWNTYGANHSSINSKLNKTADNGKIKVKNDTLFLVEQNEYESKIDRTDPYTESLIETFYYRITARGQGQDHSNALVQTIYAKNYD